MAKQGAKRRIAVVTGSRAEYGLLRGLMKSIRDAADLELQVIACAMHLAPEYGRTADEIAEDGFEIAAEVEMLLASDSRTGTAKALALGILGFSDAFARLKPDLLVLLGDRFEILAAAQTALIHGTAVAHIHGGERTEGAFDDAIRHSVTKLAHLHFTTDPEYRGRVIQMGEAPERVFSIRPLGFDDLAADNSLAVDANLASRPGVSESDRFFLIALHPVTLNPQEEPRTRNSLDRAFQNHPDFKLVFTKPNADPGGRKISEWIDDWVRRFPMRCQAYSSLPRDVYLGLLKRAHLLVGNSSTGILEAPFLGIPVIDVGERQRGRRKPDPVIACGPEEFELASAFAAALSPAARAEARAWANYFWDSDLHRSDAARIVEVLSRVDLGSLRMKKFHDLAYG